GLAPRPAQIPIYSTVTGRIIDGTDLDADYWWRNVRQPVRFGAAIEAMVQQGSTTFLELSAHPVLSTFVKQSLHSLPNTTNDDVLARLMQVDFRSNLTTLPEASLGADAIQNNPAGVGLAMVVVDRESSVLTRAYGFRIQDGAVRRKATPSTAFALGSATKPFTSFLVAMAAAR
ncbi:MAG: acyltransferase domain-containing protein, partial [bacterium]|nr:acyltransferase domain-containing protein [bacterium]